MLPENMSLRSRPRGLGDFVLGSWARTAAVAAALIVLVAILAGLVFSGHLGDLRSANIPVLHPYPPAGYFLNPFNPGDRGDLINVPQAARVKADLLRDGQGELDASASGDPSGLPAFDAGNRLTRLRAVIAQDASQGQVVKVTNNLISAKVGKLADPADASATWCVEETGTSVLTYVSKSTGQVIHTQTFHFVGKFWLVLVGDRYLITDAQIANTPSAG